MATTILAIFPEPKDLLALEPEELAGVLLELIPNVSQHAGFNIDSLLSQVFLPHGGGYNFGVQGEVAQAIAEALSWLKTQGIIVRNPSQPMPWYQITRRGRSLRTRADLEAYRKGRTLPLDLLQQTLVNKVHHLFLRGDHDTAVFQAFKEVEVAVRRAAKFPDSLVGRDLMQRAFHRDTGPLRDETLIPAERDAEMFLFSGAIGHAKNPAGHRDVTSPERKQLA